MVRELHSVLEVVLPDNRVRVVPKAGSVLRIGTGAIVEDRVAVGQELVDGLSLIGRN